MRHFAILEARGLLLFHRSGGARFAGVADAEYLHSHLTACDNVQDFVRGRTFPSFPLPIPIGLHSPEYSLRDLGLRRGCLFDFDQLGPISFLALNRAGCRGHGRRICGHPPSPVTGAHSRGDPPCYGRCQNDAHGNNDRNPEAGVSIQRGPCKHENDARTEQNAVCHQIDQRGDLCACRGFPCHRQPFRFHLSELNDNSPAAQWFQAVRGS